MRIIAKIICLILSITMLIAANWPSIVEVYFPLNLPFSFFGGGLSAYFAFSIFISIFIRNQH